jgi:hypothetical protein
LKLSSRHLNHFDEYSLSATRAKRLGRLDGYASISFRHPGESRDPSLRCSELLKAIAIPYQRMGSRRGTMGTGFRV